MSMFRGLTPLSTARAAAVVSAQDAAKPEAANPVCVIKTSMGEIRAELLRDEAPKTVANFIGLAEGTSPTLHTRPGAWRIVLPDGTLGDPVTEVQLLNNDAFILVENAGP